MDFSSILEVEPVELGTDQIQKSIKESDKGKGEIKISSFSNWKNYRDTY